MGKPQIVVAVALRGAPGSQFLNFPRISPRPKWGLMEQLSSSQQEALELLQGILGHHNYDVDILMNVLQTLNWDVQVLVLLHYTYRLCSRN